MEIVMYKYSMITNNCTFGINSLNRFLNEVIPLCYLNIYFITICFHQHNYRLKYNINATCFEL